MLGKSFLKIVLWHNWSCYWYYGIVIIILHSPNRNGKLVYVININSKIISKILIVKKTKNFLIGRIFYQMHFIHLGFLFACQNCKNNFQATTMELCTNFCTVFGRTGWERYHWPAQSSGWEVPQSYGAVCSARNQTRGVGWEGAHPDRTPARMLEHGLDLTAAHRPHHRGGIRGAGRQVLAAGAETAAVDPVTVARERRERELGEVSGGVDPDGFIGRAGGQERGGKCAAIHIIAMTLYGADQRHHFDSVGQKYM